MEAGKCVDVAAYFLPVDGAGNDVEDLGDALRKTHLACATLTLIL